MDEKKKEELRKKLSLTLKWGILELWLFLVWPGLLFEGFGMNNYFGVCSLKVSLKSTKFLEPLIYFLINPSSWKRLSVWQTLIESFVANDVLYWWVYDKFLVIVIMFRNTYCFINIRCVFCVFIKCKQYA